MLPVASREGHVFDFQPRTRIVFGEGEIERVGELARELPCSKPLLVTDNGIVSAGHAERVRRLLEAAGLKVTMFAGTHENPTTEDVDACVAVARQAQVDAIIGLGGGSAMDTAKGCNFLLTNGGAMQDYWGVNKASKPMLPLIAIPTTAGTGSEMQSFALIADAKTHVKMACGDVKAAARIALLDPALTLTQPEAVAAHTGIDALVHAVESAVTTKRNAVSWLYSREAFRLIAHNLPRVFASPDDMKARSAMLLGAAYAGTAIENSMLGAAHALANPLTAKFNIVHGEAVGLMLSHVMRYNAHDEQVRAGYGALARAAELTGGEADDAHACAALDDCVSDVLARARQPRDLEARGVTAGDLPDLAAMAAGQWTGRFNPRPVDEAALLGLYQQALHAKHETPVTR